MPGWASPARPAVYKPPVGARVASPQSPILRWSTPRVSALDWATSGLSKSPLLIARPLLLTTNCPLLLTTAVRFCSHRDTSLGATLHLLRLPPHPRTRPCPRRRNLETGGFSPVGGEGVFGGRTGNWK